MTKIDTIRQRLPLYHSSVSEKDYYYYYYYYYNFTAI